MILEKQKEALILETSINNDSIDMSLDMESASILMQMLSKTLYSDPIGSTIREWTSNALDSHRRINSKKPIIVSLQENEQGNYEFSVEDFGTGLLEEEVYSILSKYGKSTKRDKANELGCMGLGFKSGLAYSSSFTFVCRKDKIESKYIMYEGEHNNKIDLLYSSETTEQNGVKVIVNLKEGDYYSFYSKIKEQLCYFENVYFDVKNINNDFKIIRDAHWQYSEINTDNNLHICLDNVYYPIDWNKLGINYISVSVGLKFNLINSIYPTPQREAIRYNPETIKIILDKIKLVATDLVTKYNSTIQNYTIKELIDYCSNNTPYVLIQNNKTSIFSLINYSTEKLYIPKYKEFKYLDFITLYNNTKLNYLENYSVVHQINNNRFSSTKLQNLTLKKIVNKEVKVIKLTKISNLTLLHKKYFRNLDDNILFIRENKIYLFPKSKYDNNNYFKLLNLYTINKSNWRATIQEYQTFIKKIEETYFIDLDSFIISEDFIESIKVVKKKTINVRKKLVLKDTEIKVKQAVDLSLYRYNKNYKYTSLILNVNKIKHQSKIHIYFNGDLNNNIYKLFNSNCIFIQVTLPQFNELEKLTISNLISIESFMKGKTKVFRRMITYLLISDLISNYNKIFSNLYEIKDISDILFNKLTILKNYYNKNLIYDNSINETLKKGLLNLAKTNNLYDESIYTEYLECKNLLEKLNVLGITLNINNYYKEKEELINIIFKYKKVKMNYQRYNKL